MFLPFGLQGKEAEIDKFTGGKFSQGMKQGVNPQEMLKGAGADPRQLAYMLAQRQGATAPTGESVYKPV